MGSVCRNYAKCLQSLEEQNYHHGLCIDCFVACQEFIVEIQPLLGEHKLALEDGTYLFLNRNSSLEDLAKHLGTHKITDYLPTDGSLTIDRGYLQVVQAAMICINYRNAITADQLISDIIGDRKLPEHCVKFVSDHMKDCKAAELDTLLEMTTCRYLASHGVIKNCYMAPPERTGRGNHRDVWMIPVGSIILTCDKHFNWITVPKAVIELKKMHPGIVIDRNTLRRYVMDENLCPYDEDLYGELAIPVSILPEVPSRYRKIQKRLKKNRGIFKDSPKPHELTPEQIFRLLDEKIPYKTILNYLNKGIIPGTKRHGRWISTTDQYKEFLQKATNGVRGMRPEHISVCREHLQKSQTLTKAEQ